MTPTTYALLVLAALTALGCVAFALPPRPVKPHPFETDPLTDEGDHIGRHEDPNDLPGEGPTTRLHARPLHTGRPSRGVDPT